jgi:hypothetical protein
MPLAKAFALLKPSIAFSTQLISHLILLDAA